MFERILELYNPVRPPPLPKCYPSSGHEKNTEPPPHTPTLPLALPRSTPQASRQAGGQAKGNPDRCRRLSAPYLSSYMYDVQFSQVGISSPKWIMRINSTIGPLRILEPGWRAPEIIPLNNMTSYPNTQWLAD